MKIKLLILDQDRNYIQRMVKILNQQYSNHLEIYSFTDKDLALEQLKRSSVDVFLVSNLCEITDSEIPSNCGFAYLVESLEITNWKDKHTICKFQKTELIYQEIQNMALDAAMKKTQDGTGDGENKVISFLSMNGGAGSSTAAAACAYKKAIGGARVLYLNLEQSGRSSQYFSGVGKVTGKVNRDESGVYFYDSCPTSLDLIDSDSEEIKKKLEEMKTTGGYDFIILDLDFNYQQSTLSLLKESNCIVCVLDGSETSYVKFNRSMEKLRILVEEGEQSFLQHMVLFYNKFNNKTGRSIDDSEFKVIGGAPNYAGKTTKQIMDQFVKLQIFDRV